MIATMNMRKLCFYVHEHTQQTDMSKMAILKESRLFLNIYLMQKGWWDHK